jgi:hypothetical protein
MIILVGPNPVSVAELPQALAARRPILYADWHGTYNALTGDAARVPPSSHSLARVVAEFVALGKPLLLVGMSSTANKRIAKLLRHFPEVTGLRGLKSAAAILGHCDETHLPSPAQVATLLGWNAVEITTPLRRSLTKVELTTHRKPVTDAQIPQLTQQLASTPATVVIAPQPPNGTPGDALWLSGTPVLRMTEWPSGARPDTAKAPISLKRRLASWGRLRRGPQKKAQSWSITTQDVRKELRVPGTSGAPASWDQSDPSGAPTQDAQSHELVIGSLNTAGQAYQWARGAQSQGINATSNQFVRRNQNFVFPAHITTAPQNMTLRRRLDVFRHLMWGDPHVLVESFTSFGNLPIVGGGPVQGLAQLNAFAASNIQAAAVFHGSDVRRPSRYRANHEFSPFGSSADPDFVARLETNTTLVEELLADYSGPRFVSTLDLLDDVPQARWLPQVVDPRFFDIADMPGSRAAIS